LKTGTARIAPAFIFKDRSAAILAPFALKSGTPASWRLWQLQASAYNLQIADLKLFVRR
jgi:hypothetical protein